MGDSFVCINGIDLEAAAEQLNLILGEMGANGILGQASAGLIIAAALGECIPATVESRGNSTSPGALPSMRRFVSAWQPVRSDTE